MSELTIRFKRGVNARSLRPEILKAMFDAAEIYEAHEFVMTVTSANDSAHGTNSLHYKNLAIDLRVHNIANPALVRVIRDEIAAKLGADYDVILEHVGLPQAHIHVEFDPKPKTRQT